MFELCKNKKWEFLIRYKDGSIPSLAEEYREIKGMGEAEEKIIAIEEIFKRKPKELKTHQIKWVNDLSHDSYTVSVFELAIKGKKGKDSHFQSVTSLRITGREASGFAETGRKRWLIENEGFNIQKNIRYFITHANSLDYTAMKNHYLLTQLADMLLQLYERGVKGLKIIKRTLAKISEGLLECLRKHKLTAEDLDFERIQIRKEPLPCG